jgi:hypothetical protein
MARHEGLARTMATFLLKRPRRPDPLDPSIEKPRRLSDLEGPFFAALRDLKLVEKIADLAQVPADWRREAFKTAVRKLLWVVTVRALMAQHTRAQPNAKDIMNARNAVLRARDALQQLGGLVDAEPLEPMIADLSLLLGANPERGAGATGGGRPLGSDSIGVFKDLIRGLLSAARSFGVGLTLSKEADEPRGTLVKVLEVLTPHLACIPSSPSYKTLERIRAKWSQSLTE